MTSRFVRCLVPVALVCLLLFACKPAGGKVETQISGKVTYKGAPLGGGNIEFHFANGGSGPAMMNADGTYTVQNVPGGPAKVGVETEGGKGAGTGRRVRREGPPAGRQQ